MTILMDDKTLKITKYETVYKFETGIDNIEFLIPQLYKDKNIAEMSCIALVLLDNEKERKGLYKFVDYEEELYKNRLKAVIPITSTITKNVGIVSVWLMFVKKNPEDTKYADSVLETDNVIFYVYDNGSEASSSEEKFDEIWDHTSIDELESDINNLSEKLDNKADTVLIDENNILTLKSGDNILCSVQLRDDVTWEEL